jgi:hypothetical protein
MSVKDKAGVVGQMAKSKVREARLEGIQERAERLKMKNDLLRDELNQERAERERMVEALEHMGGPKRHRIRGLFLLTAAAGSAYVMGSKAGRERYEQLRSWFDDMRGKSKDFDANAWADQARDTASRAAAGMQDMGDRAASSIQDKGSSVANTIQQTAGTAASKVEEGTSSAARKVDKASSSAAESVDPSTTSGSESADRRSTGGRPSTGS